MSDIRRASPMRGGRPDALYRRGFAVNLGLVASLVSLLGPPLGACGSGDLILGTQSNQIARSCQSAGGSCLSLGSDPCASVAPPSAQDCNPQLLPSGPFCCLSSGDGGDADASGESRCEAAGGTCLPIGGSPCASAAPDSAQDCNPQLLPSGPFCCLTASDSGTPDSPVLSACKGAGGTCLPTGNAACTLVAPNNAQDCNPQLLPSGPFCCLTL